MALVAAGTEGLTRAAEQVLQLYVASKGRLMDQELQAYLAALDVAAERVPLEVHDSILELLHLLVDVQAEVFSRAPPSELPRVRPGLHTDCACPCQQPVCTLVLSCRHAGGQAGAFRRAPPTQLLWVRVGVPACRSCLAANSAA